MQPRRIVGDEKHRKSVIALLACAGENGNSCAGQLCARAPDLVAIKHPFVTFKPGRRASARCVRSRLGFADGNRELGFAPQKRCDISRMLFGRTVGADVLNSEHGGHYASRGIQAVLTNCFAEDRKHDRVGLHAAKLLRYKET